MNEKEEIIKLIKDYEYDTAYDLFVSTPDNSMGCMDFLNQVVINKVLCSDFSIEDEDKSIIKKIVFCNQFKEDGFDSFNYFRSFAEDTHYSYLDSLYDDGFTEDYDGPPKDQIKDGKKLIEDFISEIKKAIKEITSSLSSPMDDDKSAVLANIKKMNESNTSSNVSQMVIKKS